MNIILNDERLRIITHQPTAQSTQFSLTQFALWIETVRSEYKQKKRLPAFYGSPPPIHVCVSEGSPDFIRRVEGRNGIMGLSDYKVQSLGYVATCNT